MFYCLFDLIEFFRKEKKETTDEMLRFFRTRKITKAKLTFFSQNCSVSSDPDLISAVSEYTGLTELEIFLSLGIIPEDKKTDYFKKIKDISKLLNDTSSCEKVSFQLEPYFKTSLGTLYNEDCVKVLQSLKNESVDLIFADPPFNLDKTYDDGINDNLSMSGYINWCYQWINECIRVLRPGGSIFIYNIPKWGAYFSEFLNKRLTMRSWISVDMKFSLPLAGRLYPAHYSLLYYIKGDKPNVFNNQRIPLQTCRHCGGEIKDYGGYKNKMNPNGVNVSDVWTDIYPVRHRSQKNRAYNELSIKMLDRVISMASNPGDVVFDPFGGSGTTYVVAELLGRKWIGSELGNCDIITTRFKNIGRDEILLNKVNEEKNTIFPEHIRALRRKNGFWLSEDFNESSTQKITDTNHQIELSEYSKDA